MPLLRQFAGLSGDDPIPDETTILNFQRLLEKHGLGEQMLAEVNEHLADKGLFLREGTIADATNVAAPTSTKNKEGKRAPEMHQARKGNQWHFGMNMHAGVDAASGLVHTVKTAPANVHDITQAAQLMHGEEQDFWGEAGYQGVGRREEMAGQKVDWLIAARPGKRKNMCEIRQVLERKKAQVRAKVEHPFRHIKQVFGYDKVRYRGWRRTTTDCRYCLPSPIC